METTFGVTNGAVEDLQKHYTVVNNDEDDPLIAGLEDIGGIEKYVCGSAKKGFIEGRIRELGG